MIVTKRKRRVLLILLGILCLCILICSGQQLYQRKTPPVLEAPIETEPEPSLTLESLLGEDYVQFVTDTITMQMENRMVKNPEVRFYSVVDHVPLSDYAAINEQTQFELDEKDKSSSFFQNQGIRFPVCGMFVAALAPNSCEQNPHRI